MWPLCFNLPLVNSDFNSLLKATSRSFYLTLRVLPARVRPQIGLAYLLARTTDTIADTELVPVQGRLDALESLRGRILGETGGTLDFGSLALGCALPAKGFAGARGGDIAPAGRIAGDGSAARSGGFARHHERAGTGSQTICRREGRISGRFGNRGRS